MMRMMMNKIRAVLAAALCMLLCIVPVSAETVDLNRTGSLSLTVHDGSTPVPGGTITIYKVGNIVEDDGNPRFELTDDFAPSNIPLTNPENESVVEALVEYAHEKNIPGTTDTVPENATITFPSIPLGLYLVVQEEAAENYEAMAPFLISIPNWNEKEGEYIYEVSAYPKSDPAKLKTTTPTTPSKVADSTTPSSIASSTKTSAEMMPYYYAALLILVALFGVLIFRKRKNSVS